MAKPASPNSVYIVMAGTDYEGSSCVRAFLARAEAEQFAHECNAYSAIDQPACPGLDAPDAEWDKWYAEVRRWRELHPAGDNYDADSYYVSEVPLVLPQSVAAVDPGAGTSTD